MSLVRTLSDLTGPLKRQLLLILILPLVAVVGFLVEPGFAAAALVGPVVVTVVTAEILARRVSIDRAGAKQRRVLSIAVALNGIALTLVGIAILRSGGGDWTLMLIGGAVGAFVAVDIIWITSHSDGPQLIVRGLLVSLLLIVLMAAILGLGHLFGMGIGSTEATLAASGLLGLFLVYAIFIARDVDW